MRTVSQNFWRFSKLGLFFKPFARASHLHSEGAGICIFADAGLQTCKRAETQACRNAGMHVDMQVCKYTHAQMPIYAYACVCMHVGLIRLIRELKSTCRCTFGSSNRVGPRISRPLEEHQHSRCAAQRSSSQTHSCTMHLSIKSRWNKK